MAEYTILDSKYVASLLKLAQRATRQAMMTDTGDDHIAATRILLGTLDGTQATAVSVAKSIIDLVKDDLQQ